MPADDQTDLEVDARVAAIKADLDYFQKALSAVALQGHPPTVYASKYADDVAFLLKLAGRIKAPEPAAAPSELETALAHDKAGRVERKTKP